MPQLKYKRILLKLSGEALMGNSDYGISPEVVYYIAKEIYDVYQAGVELAIVIGGGNIYRGLNAQKTGIDRTTGDYMGMLATAINSLALQDQLEKLGLFTRVMSAITISAVAEPYIRRRAIRHLEKGRLVIFAAGTGNPFFTTDTAASLRALEINADVIIKATKVEGIFDKDPKVDPTAVKFDKITYQDVLNKSLKVMDATAIALCMENRLPILVYNMTTTGYLMRLVQGENIGTLVSHCDSKKS